MIEDVFVGIGATVIGFTVGYGFMALFHDIKDFWKD